MVCVTIINKFFICFTEFLESCVINNFLFQKKTPYKVICVILLTSRYCIYLYLYIFIYYIYFLVCVMVIYCDLKISFLYFLVWVLVLDWWCIIIFFYIL